MRATQSTAATPTAERQRLPPLVFGPFAFDPHRRLLSRDGVELSLPPRVLGVLELLLERAGEVVPRQEIIDTVWKDAFVTDTSLAEAVSALRQTLGDDPQSPTYIQTLHRRGYRFVAPLSVTTAARSEAVEVARGQRAAVSPSIGGALVPWSAAAICALIAVAAIWQATRRTTELTPVAVRFAIAPESGSAIDQTSPALALSADGTQIVLSACEAGVCRLFSRPLDRIHWTRLESTEDARAPFFSPDGRWVAFFANGRLKKLALAGGAPITIADAASPLGGVWIDREIVFASSLSGGLMRVSADGGEPRPLTTPHESAGEIRHVSPSAVPGTRVLLFTIETALPGAAMSAPGILAALSLDGPADSGSSSNPPRWRTLTAGVTIARAAASDVIVFARDSDLHAVAFDPVRLAISGAPRAVLGPVATARGRAHYALAANGALVHAEVAGPLPGHGVTLRPADDAKVQAWEYRDAAIAPDGSRLAGVNIEDARADIWVAETRRPAATRLTHGGLNASPVWSADSRVVYFASRRDGPFEIWARDADGTGTATRVFSSDRHAFPLTASSDGKLLAFLQTGPKTRADIWVLPLDGGAPRPLVQGPFDENAASFSPDSTQVAFQSAETGRWEVYVQRLRDGRRILVSSDGGQRPIWTRDGLFFQSGDKLMRATIADDGSELRVVKIDVREMLRGGALLGLAPDGVLLAQGTDLPPYRAIVSLGWLREVRSLLGPPASALPR
jgi:eukaryotic-like serine/threonine-protein kinase